MGLVCLKRFSLQMILMTSLVSFKSMIRIVLMFLKGILDEEEDFREGDEISFI